MFWKSTAILVQATSMPSTGLAVRPFHASADKISEAVNSDVLSGGSVDIRLLTLPRECRESERGWTVIATTQNTVHGQYYPEGRAGFWHSSKGKQANVLSPLGITPSGTRKAPDIFGLTCIRSGRPISDSS